MTQQLPAVAPASRSRFGILVLAIIIGIFFLFTLVVVLSALADSVDQDVQNRQRKEQRAVAEFQRRKDDAWAAYHAGKINLAEREGLLARIRDEEEKLKRGD